MNTSFLDSSCRVAFAALLHDLGKFAERAVPEVERDRLEAHVTNYCKWHEQGGYHSHRHAAWTALFMDEVEKSAPDLIRAETAPFSSRQGEGEITDSLVNAAAMHHRPETLLQWIIATADRVASGFEREDFETYNNAEESYTGRNHFQARLWTLFEQVRLAENAKRPDAAADFHWRYRLQPLSPKNLFPVKRDGYEPNQNEPAQAEYRALWEDFLKALEKIPKSHRQQWPLWLDHLDTLWQSYTHAIPSSTFGKNKPEVSLYDHSKATAAFAVALWRWHVWHVAQDNLSDADAICQHKERADWNENKFLLVQGDFFGIQDFIFSEGAEANKNAAKLLRGRSFPVSLFTEVAALKVLEDCELPSTSQITNAAGRFLIVAPNTPDVRKRLENVRKELDKWFLDNTFGLAGLGFAFEEACCNDFKTKHCDEFPEGRFSALMDRLLDGLDRAKLSRFALTEDAPCVFAIEYPHGVCPYSSRLPADEQGSAPLSRDQITMGTELAHKDRLLVVRDEAELYKGSVKTLEVPVFGYRIGFTEDEEVTGKFGELARNGGLVRCWDFSLPENLTDTLWHGYARRYINAYVPQFESDDLLLSDKYRDTDAAEVKRLAPKTFNHLACEDRVLDDDGKTWIGQIALATLKGDVDNLGLIFQKGLEKNTFAKMAALSRQMNAFFAVWLSAFCKENYPDTYTVFAGGDDFFLIGPWRSTQKLAAEMATHFKAFVAENPEIHFSAGIVTTKPGHPVHALAEQAETALETVKGYECDGAKAKNAVSVYGQVVSWDKEWSELASCEAEIERLDRACRLSTGYVYGFLNLVDLAEDERKNKKPESAIWRSRVYYRTRRYVVSNKLGAGAQDQLIQVFANGIDNFRGRFRIPLFNFFYSKRRG